MKKYAPHPAIIIVLTVTIMVTLFCFISGISLKQSIWIAATAMAYAIIIIAAVVGLFSLLAKYDEWRKN